MDKLRILFVGGPDIDSRVELIKRLRPYKCEIAVAGTNPDLTPFFEQEKIRYYYYPMHRTIHRGDFNAIILFIRTIRKFNPDLVHTFDTKPSVVGRIISRLCGVRWVVGTITGMGSLYFNGNNSKSNLLRRIYESLQSLACHLSDWTFFYNEKDAHYFSHNKMVPPGKWNIIPGSGIDLTRFNPNIILEDEKSNILKEIEFQDGEFIVVMVARLVISKGVLVFANVAKLTKRENPAIKYILVGPIDNTSLDGLDDEAVKALAPSVKWLGERKDIENILAVSNVLVLPSDREGIPRVLVEAGAMGLPVIASNLPGCSDVVINNVTGYLLNHKDLQAVSKAILHLAQNPDLCERMGSNARQFVQDKFNIDNIVKILIETYQKLGALP